MNFTTAYQDILDYWFGENPTTWPDKRFTRHWFKSSPARDAEIAACFGDRVEAALARELVDWEPQASSRLALILLLDQFTRNIHRGTARAFAGDHRAATLSLEGVSTGMDRHLHWAGQVFFYLPLMHAEDRDLQRRSEECYTALQERAPDALKETLADNLAFAREHRSIVERFGRFPHRNQALGRASTAEELEFLKDAKRYGQ